MSISSLRALQEGWKWCRWRGLGGDVDHLGCWNDASHRMCASFRSLYLWAAKIRLQLFAGPSSRSTGHFLHVSSEWPLPLVRRGLPSPPAPSDLPMQAASGTDEPLAAGRFACDSVPLTLCVPSCLLRVALVLYLWMLQALTCPVLPIHHQATICLTTPLPHPSVLLQ